MRGKGEQGETGEKGVETASVRKVKKWSEMLGRIIGEGGGENEEVME